MSNIHSSNKPWPRTPNGFNHSRFWWHSQNAMGHGRSRQTRRTAGHLFAPHSGWSDLNADSLRQKCGGEHSRPRSQTDKG